MLLGDADDLGQDGFLLVEAAAALKGLADVPVGGVQEPHKYPPGVGCYSCFKWCSTWDPYTLLTPAWQAGQYGGGSSSMANGTRDSIRPGGVEAPFDAAAP